MWARVCLGANACIVSRNIEKTEMAAKDLAKMRLGAKVIGIGAIDARDAKSLVTTELRGTMRTGVGWNRLCDSRGGGQLSCADARPERQCV